MIIAADLALGAGTSVTFTDWAGPVLGTLGLLSIASIYSLLRPNQTIAEFAAYAATWTIFTAVGCILTYVAATHAGPYRDHLLMRIDRTLGFDSVAWADWLHAMPGVTALLHAAYMSLPLQMIGSAAVFAAKARDRNEELFVCALLALLLTTLLSAVIPAVGPWLPPYYPHLAMLRSGVASSFRMGGLQGIVSFPSFHTVLAVLFVYSHRGIASTFLPIAILNGLMLVSIPSEGGHYLADMVGGLVVAIIAIAVTRAALRARGAPGLGLRASGAQARPASP